MRMIRYLESSHAESLLKCDNKGSMCLCRCLDDILLNACISHNTFHISAPVPYLIWEYTQAAPKVWMITIVCVCVCVCVYIYIYIYIWSTSQVMPHQLIYSINLKASKDFNTILTYFIDLKSTFYINIDAHYMRITNEGPKHVGVTVL